MTACSVSGYNQTNLTFMIGDTWDEPVFSIEENSNPMDIAGSTIHFTIKSDKGLSDENAEIRKTYIIPAGTPVYETLFTFESSDWTGIISGTYWYSVVVTLENGKILTAFNGKAKILQAA